MTKNRRLAVLALLSVTLIWGAALPIIKPVFSTLSVTQFLYARYLIASVTALPVLLLLPRPRLPFTKWLQVIALEIFGTPILLTILYAGVARTSALESSLIGAMSPLFTVVGGIWFLHERQTSREWQGFALALLGTLILVFEPLLLGNGKFAGSLSGNLLILTYNVCWTVYLLLAKKLYRKVPKLMVGAVSDLIGFAAFGAYLLFAHAIPGFTLLSAGYTPIPILYMGLLGSLFALSLYLYGQNKIEASEASVYTYLQPLVAIPVAYYLLGEIPTLITLLAIFIIALGVYQAEKKN